MLAGLEPAASPLADWATDAALPPWGTAGFDSENGRFEERLKNDPLTSSPYTAEKRFMLSFSVKVARR